MLLTICCGVILLGSTFGSALTSLSQGYRSYGKAADLKATREMVDGTEEFIEERYRRIWEDLMVPARTIQTA